MKRLTDASVALLFVVMVVVTYKNLTRKPPPAPPPAPAEPVPDPQVAPPAPPRETRPEMRPDPQPAPWNVPPSLPPQRVEERSGSPAPERGVRETLGVEPRAPSREPDFPGVNRTPTTSTVSEIDVQRKQAREQLARLFQTLGPNGRALIQNVERHVRSCGNETEGLCAQSLENIGRQVYVVGTQLDAAQELARTSWLPPGEIRELREKHGIDDGVFDQIVRIVNRYRR
jgi:hypothetical protein